MTTITARETWTPASWNTGDERTVFVNGDIPGELIGEVKRDTTGEIVATVHRIIVPEHADEPITTLSGFSTLDVAQEWVETTIELLTA